MDYTVKLSKLLADDEEFLVGYNNGVMIRDEIKNRLEIIFDLIEKRYDRILVEIPDSVTMISDSFIRGLFGDQIRRYKREFLNKYYFVGTPLVVEKIDRIVDRLVTIDDCYCQLDLT